jgi:hypothetical protein
MQIFHRKKVLNLPASWLKIKSELSKQSMEKKKRTLDASGGAK